MGVHIYLYSDDVLEVSCPQGTGNAPWPKRALCHAISDANGKFTLNMIPCGNCSPVYVYRCFLSSRFSLISSVVHIMILSGMLRLILMLLTSWCGSSMMI